MRFASVALTLLFIAVPAAAGVGFYSPGGIPQAVVGNTQIGFFNAVTPEQVGQVLDSLDGTDFKAFIDLEHIITHSTNPAKLRMAYTTGEGVILKKVFAPGQNNTLRTISSNADLRKELAPLMPVLAKHAANVGAIFLVDEPYLNGISKSEMERAGQVVRDELDTHGLGNVKLGVIFASGMFNRAFAHLMNDQAGTYAARIDGKFRRGSQGHPKAFAAWVRAIRSNRLVTYDRAGNMYTGGGLPQGFDIYGFDFYLSTILLDGAHEHTLSWFAAHYSSKPCSRFAGKTMVQIRDRLSFFHGGNGVLRGPYWRERDDTLLDAIYDCRMGAVTAMLQSTAADSRAEFLLVTESSNNGVLEFDPSGVVKGHQPHGLIESRVLDEVERGERFYASHECFYTAGLLFFTYKHAYDYRIKLAIGGASGMPSVMKSIYHFAAEDGARKAACTERTGAMP